MNGETIYRSFGNADNILAKLTGDEITYTDDTQMALGVAECLLQDGYINADHLAEQFGRNYQPGCAYGPGMQRIMDTMMLDGDWKTLVQSVFPGGSYGNGAAMRVAPVGLAFHHDSKLLREEARRSAAVTHLHQLGIDAAVIVATAISVLLRQHQFDSRMFFAELIDSASTEEFQWQLRTASRIDPAEMISFGSSLPAHRSVTTAITCFTVWPDSYEKTIGRAIAMGEDTDTLAAIAGALSGAHLGVQAIPKNWLSSLENGPKGRDYIERTASALYEQWSSSNRA
jgi:poly(ADP-ribose) glycohydrolase ARH3